MNVVKLHKPYKVEHFLLQDQDKSLRCQAYLEFVELNFQVLFDYLIIFYIVIIFWLHTSGRLKWEVMQRGQATKHLVPVLETFIKCGAFVVADLHPNISFVGSN